jgi:hypothetical protein
MKNLETLQSELLTLQSKALSTLQNDILEAKYNDERKARVLGNLDTTLTSLMEKIDAKRSELNSLICKNRKATPSFTVPCNGLVEGLEVTVTRGRQTDVDNQDITVEFTSKGLLGTHKKEIEGHINNRTNFVHLSYDSPKQEKEFIHFGVLNLDKVIDSIENREIEIQ